MKKQVKEELSPFTGKPMTLHLERRTMEFRKDEITYWHHYYLCEDTKEGVLTEELIDLNTKQIYNAYRALHRLPFTDEIIATRNKYGLSARKMSEVLGMGENQYSNYEKGEVPSLTNAKLIQLAAKPREFEHLVKLSEALSDKDREKILLKVKQAAVEEDNGAQQLEEYILGVFQTGIFSGYRQPSIERFALMTGYFAEKLQPFKVKLCKLLFYADFSHYRKTGFSISGIHYKAINLGPVPNNFDHLFLYAEERKYITIECKIFDHSDEERVGVKFLPAQQPVDKTAFDTAEMETLNEVVQYLGKKSTEAIVDISHKELAWVENIGDRKFISYDYAFKLKGI
jgi:putative zinc finger/helix-turn-helix YgiT family protein